jgi:hypothetical protein
LLWYRSKKAAKAAKNLELRLYAALCNINRHFATKNYEIKGLNITVNNEDNSKYLALILIETTQII